MQASHLKPKTCSAIRYPTYLSMRLLGSQAFCAQGRASKMHSILPIHPTSTCSYEWFIDLCSELLSWTGPSRKPNQCGWHCLGITCKSSTVSSAGGSRVAITPAGCRVPVTRQCKVLSTRSAVSRYCLTTLEVWRQQASKAAWCRGSNKMPWTKIIAFSWKGVPRNSGLEEKHPRNIFIEQAGPQC